MLDYLAFLGAFWGGDVAVTIFPVPNPIPNPRISDVASAASGKKPQKLQREQQTETEREKDCHSPEREAGRPSILNNLTVLQA